MQHHNPEVFCDTAKHFVLSNCSSKFSVGRDLYMYPTLHNGNTVSHFSYAPFFQGPHFLTKMLESNILYDYLFIDILSV